MLSDPLERVFQLLLEIHEKEVDKIIYYNEMEVRIRNNLANARKKGIVSDITKYDEDLKTNAKLKEAAKDRIQIPLNTIKAEFDELQLEPEVLDKIVQKIKSDKLEAYINRKSKKKK